MKAIFNRLLIQATVMVLLLMKAGCGAVGVLTGGGGGSPAPRPEPRSYPSYHSLDIPPGHLPPPGKCRIWHPGKPPGHQPPPVSCDEAYRNAGMDNWVISRSDDDPKILQVKEKKKRGVNVEIIVNYYKID